ncbi:hypothetical protein GPJ56_000373 [Histomonas meleagridis]|uniref:uncharacterized protein n=1 Tax=Histomonas meleagridis TaxID=135588 RepID=UPI003559FF0F|nr:hypothetical protein GPJ56_000373 [Histomonas meleagridis]KAH0796588.1 hypothetical protein GO595_010481 [Histomonas meleagridis]
MEKLFQIGGASFLNIVTQLIESFFQLWSINQSTTDDSQSLINSSLMNNIVTILEMIPFNSPLMINLAPMILTQLMKDITEYPDNLTLTEQIRIAGVFSHKVSPPLEVQFMFLTFILNLNTDPSLLSTNLVILLCPLILSSINIIKNLGILPQIMQLCNILLQNEQDPETITQGLIICSCLIQSENGIEFFPFVTTALQILINKPKIIILFGVLYVLSAAFCVNFDDAITLINVEIVNLICHMLREKDVVMSYREIKLAVFVLVKFANLGNNEAYEIAASLFRQLFEMEKLDKKIGVINGDNMLDLENLHRNENVISLAPYVLMPLDNIDEMKEFMQVTEKNGLLGTLENGINDIVNAFIQ